MKKNYVDGKPDYADAFEDDLIFKWDSQIGKGLDSSYMKDVLEAERKHLLVKKVGCGNKLLLHGTIHCGGSQKCPERR